MNNSGHGGTLIRELGTQDKKFVLLSYQIPQNINQGRETEGKGWRKFELVESMISYWRDKEGWVSHTQETPTEVWSKISKKKKSIVKQ